jgi:uncharacterized membrane protein
VRLQYDPPAGKVGAWLSALLGEDPAQQIQEDLQRLRELFDGASPAAPAALAGDRLQVQPEVG